MASNAIVLTNKDLVVTNVLSADEEEGQFIDQPQPAANNTGSLTLASSGNYYGTGTLNLIIVLKTAGDVGTSKFIYTDDSKVTNYGMNPEEIWTDVNLITGSI